ncbi:MAG: DnaJ domain-containing protein [Spirochaetes bacterium]|nr:DnaJ domain-containing protein [Spirochaetota bacterium]
MIPPEFRVGHICGRCGTLFQTPVAACSRCGAADIRPFYDYYMILGVAPGADEGALKSAYKKLSLKYHPDVNPQGKDMFLLVSEAFQALKDPSKSRPYAERLAAARAGRFAGESPAAQGAWGTQADDFGFTWSWRTPSQEETERMYREFHRIHRMSQISSRLTAVLAAILGGLFASWSFAGVVPAFLLGFVIGRLNPGWAPGLVRLMNLVTLAAAAFAFYILLRLKLLIAVPVLLLGAWFFFATLRRWGRELGRS